MHPAWAAARGHEWVPLAPGVEFHLRRLDGVEEASVQADTASAMAKVVDGRATLEALGFDDDALGAAQDLEQMAGLSVFLFACRYAALALDEWRGVEDPETGEPIEITPESIHAALRFGSPDGSGPALLMPFMAWVEGPQRPVGAEKARLRALAEYEFKGGDALCDACDLERAPCARMGSEGGVLCPRIENAPVTLEGIAAWDIARAPGLWVRAGMGGHLAGLDYRAALEIGGAREGLHLGRLFECFRAIEAGALKGSREKAEAEAEAAKGAD